MDKFFHGLSQASTQEEKKVNKEGEIPFQQIKYRPLYWIYCMTLILVLLGSNHVISHRIFSVATASGKKRRAQPDAINALWKLKAGLVSFSLNIQNYLKNLENFEFLTIALCWAFGWKGETNAQQCAFPVKPDICLTFFKN